MRSGCRRRAPGLGHLRAPDPSTQRRLSGLQPALLLRRYGVLRTRAAPRALLTEAIVAAVDAALQRDLAAPRGRLEGWRAARGRGRHPWPPMKRSTPASPCVPRSRCGGDRTRDERRHRRPARPGVRAQPDLPHARRDGRHGELRLDPAEVLVAPAAAGMQLQRARHTRQLRARRPPRAGLAGERHSKPPRVGFSGSGVLVVDHADAAVLGRDRCHGRALGALGVDLEQVDCALSDERLLDSPIGRTVTLMCSPPSTPSTAVSPVSSTVKSILPPPAATATCSSA